MPVFQIPIYPFERLRQVRSIATAFHEEVVDLSIGTPVDAPSPEVLEILGASGRERGYPPSPGSDELRSAIAHWLKRSFGADCDRDDVTVTIGSKEFITSLPGYLRLLRPERNVVLYPEISYPSYAMGALLHQCEAYPVRVGSGGELLLDSVPTEIAQRSLVLWVNAPSNPTGQCTDLTDALDWAQRNGAVLASDECYSDFIWDGARYSVLQLAQEGVLAVHSLSKRSNLAGLRLGSVSGDPELVRQLSDLRRHAGMMVPGPIQSAGVWAYSHDELVEDQRRRYRERLVLLRDALVKVGFAVQLPQGGFYLWFRGPEGRFRDGFEVAEFLARHGGIVGSPGEFYGSSVSDYLRLAVVTTTDVISRIVERLSAVSL
ncbi:MAG: aminotransferase class I/II-fold pyridoxal phosphate-dependent enzyme [Acidimicrobiales bacterium]